MKMFSVGGSSGVTIKEIIRVNNGQISEEEIEELNDLEVGKSIYLGFEEVSRLPDIWSDEELAEFSAFND